MVLSGRVFFAWGEIYSLFPATCADIYGKKYCTTIYGMLYTAKGTASLLVPLSSYLSQTRVWMVVLVGAAVLDFAAAAIAVLALEPARLRVAATETILPGAVGVTRV